MNICASHLKNKREGGDWSQWHAPSAEAAARQHALETRAESLDDEWNGQVIVKDPAGNMTIFDVDITVEVDVRDLGEYDEAGEEG